MKRGKRQAEGYREEGTRDGPMVYVREKAVESEDGTDFEYYVGQSSRGWSGRTGYTTNNGTQKIDRGNIIYAEAASSDLRERLYREQELYAELVSQGLTVEGGR